MSKHGTHEHHTPRGRHDEHGQEEGYTAAYSKEVIIDLLRSGYFKNVTELAAHMAHNKLGHPERVDRIHIRSSRLNRSAQ